MIGNYIKAAKAALTTAKLMKTGQTTSYRTGDDGDLERGRNVSFTVLAENNPFGNTNRFTDELGGQTYTNNIVIDWSTYNGSNVLGWRRTLNASNINWANSIDSALLVSISTFTSGWRLPNVQELFSIMNWDSSFSSPYAYSPFSIGIGFTIWSSNTYNLTAAAYGVQTSSKQINAFTKTDTSNYRFIPCRTFTVTGTTLS